MKPSLALASCALVLTIAACSGKPVQLTAQAGSTIVIPLNIGTRVDSALGLGRVGYGVSLPQGMPGKQYADPQRGRLVVELQGTSPTRTLLTRWVFLAEAPTGSKLEQMRTWAGREVFLVADIPDDLSGVYGLEIYHERFNPEAPPGQQNERELALANGESYFGELTIIPSPLTVDHDGDPGTPDKTFEGSSTPFLFATGSGMDYGDYPFQPENAVPLPSFGIEIREPPPGSSHGSSWLAYAEVEVDYPSETIAIQDVVLSEPHRGRVWWVDRDGLLKIYMTLFLPFTNEYPGLSMYASGALELKASPLRVVFELENPASDLLETVDITSTLTRATDETGADLLVGGSGWSLSAASAIPTEIQ